jgi:hypothetical protein
MPIFYSINPVITLISIYIKHSPWIRELGHYERCRQYENRCFAFHQYTSGISVGAPSEAAWLRWNNNRCLYCLFAETYGLKRKCL